MGLFERYLSAWVALGIATGVGLGLTIPAGFQAVAAMEFAQVNLVVAVFIWVMIYPMMIQIDWSAMKDVGNKPRGLLLTLVVNWLIKPFTMALLGVLFFKYIFAPWVEPQSASEYIAGMILLGVAPCTAMVFVWCALVKGDANYTLVQVSINDLIMVLAFAPIAGFLLGVTDISVPWETLVLSTLLYVVLPLLAGMATRHALLKKSDHAVAAFVAVAVATVSPDSSSSDSSRLTWITPEGVSDFCSSARSDLALASASTLASASSLASTLASCSASVSVKLGRLDSASGSL